jgi:hypothetical protein
MRFVSFFFLVGVTYLPGLPENLNKLYCSHNKLAYIPDLPENILSIVCYFNPIYEIINSDDNIIIKQKIQILNTFRYTFYSLKFKNRFRKMLWEKIREPKIMKKYHPDYLIEHLHQDSDLEIVLDNWINA